MPSVAGPPVSASSLLELWELVRDVDLVQRGLVLAEGLAEPAAPAVAELPVGRRDAMLLDFRMARRGPELDAVVECPACAEAINFTLDAAALRRLPAEAVKPVDAHGYLVTWRPVDSTDLLAASACGDPDTAEALLLARCVSECLGPGGSCAPGEMPAAVRDAVGEAMARVDPLAEVLVDLGCPECGEGFVSEIDVVAFVWDEVRAGALRLFRDVDVLARVYGWTEPEVLALTDARRAVYVAMASEGVR